MKIKTKKTSYLKVVSLPKPRRFKPSKPSRILKKLIYLISKKEVQDCAVTFIEKDMELLSNKTPCLILMNHSCFLDLKIAYRYFKKRVFNTVCTSDGLVGKSKLMRMIGCLPTNKFVTDVRLVKDVKHALTKNKKSVLIFPEASYSFDGTATPLPESLGKLIKLFEVPVVTLITNGAFLHDPLYNNLQQRKSKVTVNVTYLLTPEKIKELSSEQINALLKGTFSFDGFRYQQQNKIVIDEPFRADGLNRVLYKCPHCMGEHTVSKGVTWKCKDCGATYTLDEHGYLVSDKAIFNHVPDWYEWQRQQIRKEIEEGNYNLSLDVNIGILCNYKAIYMVGEGKLTHDKFGFTLTGEQGLFYTQSPLSAYSLYSDYFWYEIGDVICIGTKDYLYYCFPKNDHPVAKTRLAVEELYKLIKKDKSL